MKVYKGKRLGEGELDTGSDVVVTVSKDGGIDKHLAHHVYHSPTGFSWGYGSSGPADLARSILWDLFGKEPPRPLYMRFKDKFVSAWKVSWEMTSKEITEWITKEYNKNYCNHLMSTDLSDPRD